MKIKHWQGYGTVDAKKVSKTTAKGYTTLVIRVTGDHEWGLVCKDIYHLKRWLIDRFDKSAPEDDHTYLWRFDCKFVEIDGKQVESCVYTFTYPAEVA